MSIVCLGWGSLIWDARELPVTSQWTCDGPELPVEFARQSSDGRITLVVTEGATPLSVFFAELGIASIEDARAALAARERISAKFIDRSVGYWSADSISDHHESCTIGLWAEAAGHDGVVWTALKPRFDERLVTPTGEEIVQYLGALAGETRRLAEEYIRRTPVEIRTAYRTRIERQLGWTPLE